MDKNKQKNALIVFCAVLLVINFFQNRNLKEKVEELQNGYNGLANNMQYELTNIRSSMQENSREIKELMEKGQSLFSEASADLKLQGKKLAVTMSAVPKELRPGEILTARVTAGGQIYEKELDEHNRAVLVIDVADCVEPSFVLTSPAGTRQESLDALYTGQLFTCEVQGNWSRDAEEDSGRNLFYAWISPGTDRDALPFEESDIEEAQFIIKDTGIVETPPSGGRHGSSGGSENVAAFMSAGTGNRVVRIPEGVPVAARKLAEGGGGYNGADNGADSGSVGGGGENSGSVGSVGENSGGSVGYTADLSEYTDKLDGIRYEIYFMLTTKDGMRYVTPDNSIGTFSTYEGGKNRRSGGSTMWPIFESGGT